MTLEEMMKEEAEDIEKDIDLLNEAGDRVILDG